MRRECRECFPRHRLLRKPLVSDPGMHHGTCVTHVTWCMSGSPTRGGGENVPGIPGACATRNIAYLVRGLCDKLINDVYCNCRNEASLTTSYTTELFQSTPMWQCLFKQSDAALIRTLYHNDRLSMSSLFTPHMRSYFPTIYFGYSHPHEG